MGAREHLYNAQMFFANNVGEFDRKTKEVEHIIRMVENTLKEH